MRDSSRRKRKWLAPLVCAAVVLVFLGALLILPAVSLSSAGGDVIALLAVALYVLPIAAVVVGVVIALVQRLREIKGGEEEDAKKY